MSKLTVNETTCFYEQSGRGPHLLLLHGFTGSLKNWEHLLHQLSSHYTVTRIDILGHGRSDSPANPQRYQMAAIAQDLIEICAQLKIEQFHLLGYSMGGRLAFFTAVTYPKHILSLTLESSSPGLATLAERDARKKRDNALADRIEEEGIESFVNFWESLSLWESQKQLSEESRFKLREQRLKNNPQGLANSLRGMGTGVQPSLWPKLPTLQIPTRLIVGELDQKFVKINQQMAAQLPNATLHIIPQAGHTVHLEKPDDYLATGFKL
ncbi:MAG: 2-succinyl-6-hydroxy-2,4-cyclohexadiene-1-carboxylate synthase [Chloroflexota bacterium]